ncbi:oligopeptide/dipeptide ABC transporter ATP-binding protein [Desulforhabdus amnigena]|uniref:ABC transporter ATP-binding protein n=1 Tax=Desulforhabdus amnigena TaxID=40218 RepID=A0A9W6FV21_9BACT|nr:ABC transporter ATP-binding protein [Desulforhabdus amnigena]NLJ28493.1 ABC transporter ATP-binding protein [Deltaproteobacteria bacterium]GLI35378.1 ABC transporter ATP-binding protein [Desulforhabdus amnigena]
MLAAKNLILRAGKALYPVWKVDLQLGKEDRVALVGESGGGKTSLAWALLGRPLPGQEVLEGEVFFCGCNLLALSQSERARLYYRRIALVPQNAQDSFHPAQVLWKSAREVIQNGENKKLDAKSVLGLLAPLGEPLDLPASLWSCYPHQLSGGQKQRMALVLSLLNAPEVLLLDEPTNALDELTREKVIVFLEDWLAAHHASVILFTHDIGLAGRWAKRIAVLYRGEIVEELPGDEMRRPLHPYTKGLMNASVRMGDPPLSRRSIPGYALPISAPPRKCGFLDRCSHAMERCGRESPSLQVRGNHRVRCFLPSL